MKKNRSVRFLFLALCLMAATAAVADAQTVSGYIGNGTAARGKATRSAVVLTIPGGLHVNSNRPDSEYSIPTSVTVTAAGGARAGGVTYPRGKDKKFQFSPNTINIYEGRVVIPFTLTVPRGFKGDVVRVTARVRFQACTDEVCYPPRTETVTLSARVR
ncbi:MAG TPA: protein-disulfide reductase DsbD N-terminal domain-containing protein [Pyrinomonadaceae bacterium]|nr:protein-disulfide reductase DsbD N-terminal domain-containing protein [Pyrinomonadaceae bacterium]